tara:strand:+ start:2027 stop:4705 length:2679 start_codon:yes stop_codon:yes gene_type:complete
VAEVYVEGKRLDVFEGFRFSFNYSIADIRHPEKRSTEYSKTIKCPSTPNNDSIFGQIYDVNISNAYDSSSPNIEVNFNPNKKAEAIVIADGLPIMKGSIQLRKIKRSLTDITYEVSFLGKLIDVFGKIGDKELNGIDDDGNLWIDFSDLDHEYTQGNQQASWTAPYGAGYVYPMIDYGLNQSYTGQGWREYQTTDLRPSVYLKDVVDRVFAFAGFTYTSSFLSSAFFSRLIVPWTNEGFLISDADRLQYEIVAVPDSLKRVFYPTDPHTLILKRLEFDDFSPDPHNLWNPNYDAFLTLNAGLYSIDVAIKLKLEVIALGAPTYANIVFTMRLNSDIGVLNEAVIWHPYYPELDVYTLGATTTLPDVHSVSITDVFIPSNVHVWAELYFYDPDNNDQDISALVLKDYIAAYQTTECFFQTKITDNITDGQMLPMNSFVPEIGMSDLLLSLFNMFNLYVLPNPNQEDDLLIETRDDFYAAGGVKDWSKKLDYNKPIDLEPLAMLTANRYTYTYSEDDDYYNTRHQDKWGHTYGRANIEIDNDFLNNDKEISIEFKATPLVNDGASNRIIPKIYDADIEDGIAPTDIGIRVLYYAGLLESDPVWVLNGNAGYWFMYEYPYAGHLTHPLAPAQDINFGVPTEIYYRPNGYTGTILYTNDNLFNRYHRRGLLEITNKDSKLMTAHFQLSPIDIHKLDFRDQIVIDNSYWRINKVLDYNPFDNDLTKVELIKVISKEPLKMETFVAGSGGTISGGSGKEKRPILRKAQTRSNVFPAKNGKVQGKGNYVGEGSMDFMVRGDNNSIGVGSRNVTIVGDRNSVRPSLHNVTILNCSGVSATRSNQTFVNNREQESSEILEGGENEVRDLDGGTNIFTVDGGENIVQTQFSQSSIYLVEGNN